MSIKTKAVVRDIKVEEIRVGDKLLQDVVGYGGKTLLMQGTFISPREIIFLRKVLAHTKPTYSPERYIIGKKTVGAIFDKQNVCLVRAGQQVTEELCAPLLKEGFEVIPGEEGRQMFYRKNEWPKGEPWHINDFNPLVRVETMSYLDEKTGQELPDPRGKQVRVGQEADKAKAGATA